MADVLIIGDTFRSPELRHEMPLGIGDPFVYLERDGARHVYVGSMEGPRPGLGGGLTVHPLEEIGIDELSGKGWASRSSRSSGRRELRGRRADEAAVPHTFPAGHLDRLRRGGVELTVDQEVFDARRRVKAGAELAGIRRAQLAAEAGMAAGRALMRGENGDGVLWLDGEPLTVERVKAAMRRCSPSTAARPRSSSSRPARRAPPATTWARADPVRRPGRLRSLAARRRLVLFRRHDAHVVAGPVADQVREWHTLDQGGARAATALMRAGVECRAIFDAACDVFEAAGYPTQRTKDGRRGARPRVLPRPRPRRRPRGARGP